MQRWIDVNVTMDGVTWEDAVWATNSSEALVVAHWNWEVAEKIEVINN